MPHPPRNGEKTPRWSATEDALLQRLVRAGASWNTIAKAFEPYGRKPFAIVQHFHQNAGRWSLEGPRKHRQKNVVK